MRYFCGETPEGDRWSSFRWRFGGWDSVQYRNGIWFTQYGKKPVKFACYIPKTTNIPNFLKNSRWEIVNKRGGLIAGYTKKPLNFSKLWRTHESRT